jgi:hypothetical protein
LLNVVIISDTNLFLFSYLASRSVLLCEHLKHEVTERDTQLKQERMTLLELSKTEAELSGRLQGEVEKGATFSKHAADLEQKLQTLSLELEGEQRRCVKLQSGLGQQSNE